MYSLSVPVLQHVRLALQLLKWVIEAQMSAYLSPWFLMTVENLLVWRDQNDGNQI